MECLCPPPVFQSLCYLLTLQKVTDSPQFSSWSIHKGRYDAFHACLTLLQPAFNRPLFKPSSLPLPAPEFLSQSLTAAGVKLKPTSAKQPARSLHHSIDNFKNSLLADPPHIHPFSSASANEPPKSHSHASSPARSQLNATAASPHQTEHAHALSIPAPSSPSHSVERDEEAHDAQARTPRKQLQQQPPSQASPRHPPPPLLPPISGDDDEHAPSSPSTFTSAAVAAAESHSIHDGAQSSSSSRSPSPHDSPRDDTVPPPRAQARASLFPFLRRHIRLR